MNKQEAIEKINDLYSFIMEDGPYKVVLISKKDEQQQVLDIVSQIHEPQKVVVPKFVAEWIESQKESFSDTSAIDMYDNLTSGNRNGYYHEVWLWVIAHHYDFIKAWHDGYEIEQEKLYTVEIPNPNSYGNYIYLSRNNNGICLDASNDSKWKQKKRNQFTEAEIKQDFEWAWDAGYAKEVEK